MPVKDAKKLFQYCKDQYYKAKQNGYKKSNKSFAKKWVGVLELIFIK